MLTASQLRAARALVGYTRERLAEESGTSSETIKRFEQKGDKGADIKMATMTRWRAALGKAGVEFIDAEDGKGEGVRFRSAKGKR
jgi:transcriptional regulator with XRE-family HTH domain